MRTQILIALVPTLLAAHAHAAPRGDAQAALTRWLGEQPGGVAVAWIDDTGVTFFQAGRHSAQDARPIGPDTVFEIGSITKVFTTLLLAESIRAGKVAWNDPVGAPFPASNVTYLQLATHTSGLPRLATQMVIEDHTNPYTREDQESLMRSFAHDAPHAKPEPAAYSNFGMAVLGQAVAGAWSEPYPALLQRRVLTPLGLAHTVTSWRDADRQLLAPGHSAGGVVNNWDLAAYAPAGCLVSSVRDLARFVQICLGLIDTPLRESLADMLQPRVQTPDGADVFAGWQKLTLDGAALIFHDGGTGGYRSILAFDPEKKQGLVVLSNHDRELDALARELSTGEPAAAPVAAPPAAAAATATLEGFLGNYPLAPSFVIAVTAEGEALFAQATNQPRLSLEKLADDHYRVEGVDAEIVFERNADGAVVALVLHQGGIEQRAPRRPPGEKPRAPVAIAMPASALADYTGQYQLGAAQFSVTQQGDRLHVQLTGQPALPVFASARDEFFYQVVDAQLSFVRDAGGKVIALILHQNGMDQRAERVP